MIKKKKKKKKASQPFLKLLTFSSLVMHKSAFSLHHTAGAWQEVLDVGDSCFGQISHGSVAATRGAIVEEVADSCGWVLLEEIITGTEGFLGKAGRVKAE